MSKKILKIKSAIYIKNYELLITFQDGKEVNVDFYDFLKSSTNPQIRDYLILEKFKAFKIKDHDLLWGDFDLLFPIEDLYSGKISA
ncbi:DUF2442 domain-containing protein [Bacteriovorax sp. PP10]|uniref:DUF2442 domain-containing protein n=1 Tax=Bacteriovorax antarcticus TaxID=3088717 RepID=A0ABU5VU67_9BACT|nr:DUF2442 domain-containing protein [Bacteriovorax sp. PP10]MEA9356601.1 DUF2442 domain-containing protein [Bacteriovorax sp. PP10]